MPEGLVGPDQWLVSAFDSGGAVAVVVLIAGVVGALHALAPGHGKSVAAAYLLGVRARTRDALLLGLAMAAMHTLSVLVLATGWYLLAARAGPSLESLTGWMQVVAALVVVAVGVRLVRAPRHPSHDHGGHGHGHDHSGHGHGHGGHGHHDHDHHGHVAVDHRGHEQVATRGHRPGLTALALSGGLLPSPSAFLVLFTALLTGRAVAGLLAVLAFGLGMTATLTVIGTLVMGGRSALQGSRWSLARRAASVAPRVSAWALLSVGVVYSIVAVSQLANG